MSFDVKLPKNDTPKFPAACVKCGETPTTSVKVSADAWGWWSVVRFGWLYGLLTGRGFDVPSCEACARAIRSDRWKRKTAELVIVTIGVVVGMWVFREWDGIKQRVAVLGLGLLIAMPWFFFDQYYPPAVTITVTDASVTFHFADQEYAQDFANRNPSL